MPSITKVLSPIKQIACTKFVVSTYYDTRKGVVVMGCDNKFCGVCGSISIVISAILGAIVGVLFAFDLIPFIGTTAWIALGLGVLTLVILVGTVLAANTRECSTLSKCLCSNGASLLAGAVGTIVTTTVALSTVLDSALVAVIILVAIAAFFFALMLIGLTSLISCFLCKQCSR